MTRRATLIKQARSAAKNVLVVDAGNSLANELTTTREPPSNEGRLSVEMLNRQGYDAVALGEKDLHLGTAALQQRLAEAKGFGFLSANVKDKATGKLLAQPYVIKEIDGHRIALIGLTGGVPSDPADFTLVPPLDAAAEYVRRVQSQADVIILLSNAGVAANKTIAEQVPGIDLIISGGDQQLSKPLETALGTLIVQADVSSSGHAGRYMGRLVAEFDKSGKLTGQQWQSVVLDKAIPEDADMAAWVQTLPTLQPTPQPPQE